MMQTISRFQRHRLPPVREFYERELGKLGRASRGWVTARCPFHHPDKHPSLAINLATGGFYCFSCQAKGGDVIAFLELRDNLTFKQAAMALGCWDDTSLTARQRRELHQAERTRERVQAEAAERYARLRALRFKYRDAIHFYSSLLDDLSALPSWDGIHWEVASLALDELRQSEAAYAILSFSTTADQNTFLDGDEQQRAALIADVLLRGQVTDDKGPTKVDL